MHNATQNLCELGKEDTLAIEIQCICWFNWCKNAIPQKYSLFNRLALPTNG
jgi:hypothetical protein